MAACTPSIHVFLGRPLFLLSRGIQSIINFGILSSGILLTWPYHCSLFCSMISMISGFPFIPIISFICSFFILSILDFNLYVKEYNYSTVTQDLNCRTAVQVLNRPMQRDGTISIRLLCCPRNSNILITVTMSRIAFGNWPQKGIKFSDVSAKL